MMRHIHLKRTECRQQMAISVTALISTTKKVTRLTTLLQVIMLLLLRPQTSISMLTRRTTGPQ
jgi:hypothetical protein